MLVNLFYCLCVCIGISNATGHSRDVQVCLCSIMPLNVGWCAQSALMWHQPPLSRSRDFNGMCGLFARQKIIIQLSR